MGIDFNSIESLLRGSVFGLLIIAIGIAVVVQKVRQGDVKGVALVCVAAVMAGVLVFGGQNLFQGIATGLGNMISGG